MSAETLCKCGHRKAAHQPGVSLPEVCYGLVTGDHGAESTCNCLAFDPTTEAPCSDSAFPDDAEWLVYLDRFVAQTNPQSIPRSIYDRLRSLAAPHTEGTAT